MFTRRSLGDSPLEHESNDIALLDFIGRSNKGIATRGMKGIHDSGNAQTERKPDKKIVSYYIESKIVKRMKALASVANRSYSSLVTEGMKKLLKEYGF